MSKLVIILVALSACIAASDARIFTLCGLVQELRRQAFPADQLRNWVCLIQAESSMNTSLINSTLNSNGTWDWGLFQINDGFWCNRGTVPGKDCNAVCSDFVLADITRASTCAKLIYRRHGFSAWNGWRDKCNGRPLPVISHC